jgi:hypothetical protein
MLLFILLAAAFPCRLGNSSGFGACAAGFLIVLFEEKLQKKGKERDIDGCGEDRCPLVSGARAEGESVRDHHHTSEELSEQNGE